MALIKFKILFVFGNFKVKSNHCFVFQNLESKYCVNLCEFYV